MGSAGSKAAIRSIPKPAPNKATDRIREKAPQVTAQIRGSPQPFRRKTNAEWAETLKNISGAISSSPWEGEVIPSPQNQADKTRHSAQRSDEASMKLPARPQPEGEQSELKQGAKGKLTQNQVIALFNLRRKDAQLWTAEKLAQRFDIEEADARNLLKFTRTYTGRTDDDGAVRGYYKSDVTDTVTRFERD